MADEDESHYTVTAMEVAAEKVREKLEEAIALIPGFEIPHPATRKLVRAHRTVSRAFLHSMVTNVESVDWLAGLGTFDVDDSRASLQFEDAFESIARKLESTADALRFTIEARRARVAKAALRTFAVARAVARHDERPETTTILDALRRDLGRRGPGRKGK